MESTLIVVVLAIARVGIPLVVLLTIGEAVARAPARSAGAKSPGAHPAA